MCPSVTSPVRNPFTPGFGETPPIIATQGAPLQLFEHALGGTNGEGLSLLISGARGMGKTVLLNELVMAAKERGWGVLPLFSSSPDFASHVRALAAEQLRQHDPDAVELRMTSGGASLAGISVNASHDIADRYANIPEEWGSLLGRLAHLLTQQGAGLVLAIDEVQAAHSQQLYELAQRVQWAKGQNSRIAFIAAGLSNGINDLLDSEGTTFLRRAKRITLRNVDLDTATEVIRETAREGGKEMTRDAAVLAGEISCGYPYLMQLIGARSWERAQQLPVIDASHVSASKWPAIGEMIRNVHGPTLRDMSVRKMAYLAAMARDDQVSQTSTIAERMGVDAANQNTYRSRLIADGVIESAGRGLVRFAMPYMKEAVREADSGVEPGTSYLDQSISIHRTHRSGTSSRSAREPH